MNTDKTDSLLIRDIKSITEPGYYWWLPAMHRTNQEEIAKPENWTIVSWHPQNDQRAKSGFVVGPLRAPVSAKFEGADKAKFEPDYTEYGADEVPNCPWCGEHQEDVVQDFIPHDPENGLRIQNAPEYYDCWCCGQMYTVEMVDAETFQVKKDYIEDD